MNSLLPVIVLALVALVFGIFLLAVARWLGQKVQVSSRIKELPYECGIEGESKSSTRVPVQFYLTAILFILFDIEIVFLFPWALAFNDFISSDGVWYSLIGMGVFLFVFIYGLFWEVCSKALQWR